jgi:hypothetical protein
MFFKSEPRWTRGCRHDWRPCYTRWPCLATVWNEWPKWKMFPQGSIFYHCYQCQLLALTFQWQLLASLNPIEIRTNQPIAVAALWSWLLFFGGRTSKKWNDKKNQKTLRRLHFHLNRNIRIHDGQHHIPHGQHHIPYLSLLSLDEKLKEPFLSKGGLAPSFLPIVGSFI